MATKAGQLDRRIRLQRPTTGSNSFGERVAGYVEDAVVFARFVPVTGREEFLPSDHHSAKQATVFEIRFRPNVGPRWRVVYDGATYEVEDVAELGRRDGLRLTTYARDVKSGTV